MEEVSPKSQMTKIRNYEKGFMATHLINIGAKVGLFEKLRENKEAGLSVNELARGLGLHEPYLKLLCQTAYHFEILDCDHQGKFRLQPFFDEILGDRNHYKSYLQNIIVDVDLIGKGLMENPLNISKAARSSRPFPTPRSQKRLMR
jgi:hypothetical protein